MEVKTDTKEKFHVITVPGSVLSADRAANMAALFDTITASLLKNVILNLKEIEEIDEQAGEILVKAQQKFYDEHASFVICEMQKKVETFLDNLKLLELMNCTPSESEAWDIVQMEEIERELLDDSTI